MRRGISINRSRRALHAKAVRRPIRPELVQHSKRYRVQLASRPSLLGKRVDGMLAQPGARPHLLGVTEIAVTLVYKGRSECCVRAGVRVRAHVGDAQRSLARHGRASGRETYLLESVVLDPAQLAGTTSLPAFRDLWHGFVRSSQRSLAGQAALRIKLETGLVCLHATIKTTPAGAVTTPHDRRCIASQ